MGMHVSLAGPFLKNILLLLFKVHNEEQCILGLPGGLFSNFQQIEL
jgi:hypothetical protein